MTEPLTDPTAAQPPALAHRLAGLPEPERRRVVLDLVLTQVAEVLELGTAADVPPDRAIRDLGLRSLTAVQLLLRLRRITGVKLPTTAIYDHPTARALADVLVDAASGRHVLRGGGGGARAQRGGGAPGAWSQESREGLRALAARSAAVATASG
ncbi:acyl carrier protein, partial [Streptomyces tricolor]